MRIIEAGHIYELEEVNSNAEKVTELVDVPQTIRFVNNEGPEFYRGTQTQEILRVLIDRTMHCDNCLRWPNNDKIIFHLRMALVLHEARALERKVEKGKLEPELVIFGFDGHYRLCEDTTVSEDHRQYMRNK